MGSFHPILQRVTADRTGCVTGLRHQELLVSAMVLGAAIVTSDNGRHFGNMRSRSPRFQYGWLPYSNYPTVGRAFARLGGSRRRKAAQFILSSVMCCGSGLSSPRSTR